MATERQSVHFDLPVKSETSVRSTPSNERLRTDQSARSMASTDSKGTPVEKRASEVRRSFDAKTFIPTRVNAEISRRYDIDSHEIGAGGYGKVFVAKDREIKDRLVAIKKVIIFDEDKKKAFMKEVQIMKELDHPNICKLLETYEQGRFMFFVMEYCEGGEVFERIMEHGLIAESTTATIMQQAASALKYAHSRGIAHRDMKPENVCFCTNDIDNDHIKVIDWGLGFYFGQARMSSAVGSLTYAAPEVLEAKDNEGYSSACDLWSLGVVTYVMLCGKPPFWGNYTEQLKRMKREQYPMSDSTWQSVSKGAKDLIKGLLKCDPKKRLSLEAVLSHPWLRTARTDVDASITSQVLSNMRQFSNTSQFFSICVASVARQLDHRSLRDVHRVFTEMDENGDGVLELHEVKSGFDKIFGPDSEQSKEVEEMFRRLDLDGNGTIDYTEFCAAGIGERLSTEEHVLWAAFKAFDVNDDDGSVSKDEIMKVLSGADVDKVWTREVCDDVATELIARFDQDGNGSLDFQEWLKLMRECASRRADDNDASFESRSAQEKEILAALEKPAAREGNFNELQKAYAVLEKADRPDAKANGSSGQSIASRSTSQLGNAMRAAPAACFAGCGPSSESQKKDHKCSVM